MSLEDQLYPLLNLYQRLPPPIRSAAGAAYRHLPQSWRFGKHFRHFKKLASGGEQWSESECETYRFEQLRLILNHARENCRYYRNTFSRAGFDPAKFQALTDIQRCPMLQKEEVLEHREELVSKSIPNSQRLYITTGGSTGVPVGFYLQKGISLTKDQAFLEPM